MRARSALLLGMSLLLSAGCAETPIAPEDTASGERMRGAGDRYTACVTAEAEKEAGTPAAVEDIAVAAHGRCWTQWDAYRDATRTALTSAAVSREEKQLAHDRVDAQLRQFELETRRAVMDRLVQRSLAKPK